MVPKPVSFKSVWNKLKCRNDIESPTTPTRSAPKRNPLVASGGSLSSLSLKKARLTVQYPQLSVVQHDQNKNIQLTERIEPEYDVYNILMDEFALNNEKEIHKSGRSIHKFSEDITFEPPPTHRLTIGPADNSPPEVGLADSPSIYLSLMSKATPRDRGRGEGVDGIKIGTGPRVETSSGSGLPGSDLRELEGELIRRADGRNITSGGKLSARGRELDLTSGGVVDAKKISGINYMREMEDLLTFKILVATDTHLGYKEDDLYRRDDSINTFEEILYLAKTLDVDCIMHSGDLFDKNIPSRSIMYKTMDLINNYCTLSSNNRKLIVDTSNVDRINLNTNEEDKKINYHSSLYMAIMITPPNKPIYLPSIYSMSQDWYVYTNVMSDERSMSEALSTPPEVHPAVSSSNYLSLKSIATPRDRGEGSEM